MIFTNPLYNAGDAPSFYTCGANVNDSFLIANYRGSVQIKVTSHDSKGMSDHMAISCEIDRRIKIAYDYDGIFHKFVWNAGNFNV